MDPKLAILFLLISTVIGLSHLSDDRLSRVRRQLADWRGRKLASSQRGS